MPRLIISLGTNPAWQIELKPGTNSIGRGSANDFVIPDPSVSSTHCQIIVSDEGVVLRDLHSTNGTYVNRAPIQEAVLQAGQIIHLGGVQMSYVADSQPSISGAAPVARPTATAAPKRVSTVSIPVRAVPKGPVAVPAGGAVGRTADDTTPAVRVSVAATPAAQPAAVAAPRPVALAVPPPHAAPAVAMARPAVAVAAPVATAAPAVAAPALVPAGQPQFCKSHPKTQARFFCPKCQTGFCELCVSTRPGAPKKTCRHCGSDCLHLQLAIAQRASRPKGFFAMLPDAFVYPFRGSGTLILIVAAIIFGALNWLSGGTRFGFLPNAFGWSLLFSIMAVGYFFAYMQTILHSTAAGDAEMPPLPSMADFWSDVMVPCFQLIGLTIVCFGPAIAVGIWMITSGQSSLVIALIATLLFGCLYFPMAFLSVAMLDTIFGANPIQVIPSILKVPGQYLVTIILLGIVLGMRSMGDELLPLLFPLGLSTHNMTKLFAFIAIKGVWGIGSLYLLTVSMRFLGLLYFTNKEKLGWFNR
jgi:hypothetical protein